MKQHMLTHKIRDMPQHMFDKPQDETVVPPPPPPPPPREPEPEPQEAPKEQSVKRAPTETELPLPKRPPSKFREHSFDGVVFEDGRVWLILMAGMWLLPKLWVYVDMGKGGHDEDPNV